MQKILIFIIKAYQYMVSPFIGNHCRFYPTCSEYTMTAINRFGVAKGSWLALKRLSKCHPWHEGGVDLAPTNDACTHHRLK